MMKKRVIVMFILLYLIPLQDFGQQQFSKDIIITTNNDTLEGMIRKAFRSEGKIILLLPDNRKKFYSPSEVKSFIVDSINYISSLNDFYKEVCAGKRACLYQKCTNNRNDVVYNGVEAIGFKKTSDGSIGDFYIRRSSATGLDLITKKNFKKYFIDLFDQHEDLKAKITADILRYEHIEKIIESYND